MKKIVPIIILVLILGSCFRRSNDSPKTEVTPVETTVKTTEVSEAIEVEPLDPLDGYSMLQTVFLSIDKDTTADDLSEIVQASGMYFYVLKIGTHWYYEISEQEPTEKSYGSNIYDGDSIEIDLYSHDGGEHLVEHSEYHFKLKDAKAIYSFDRGYTEEMANNAKEGIYFRMYDGSKSIYQQPVIDCETLKEALDLGIAYDPGVDPTE